MDTNQFNQFKEFLILTDLSKQLKFLYTDLKERGGSENSILNQCLKLVENYTPSLSQENELMTYFRPEEVNYTSSKNIAQGVVVKDLLPIKSPAQLPNPSNIIGIYEPMLIMELMTPKEYTGKIMELINNSRGECLSMNSLSLDQLQIIARLPLAEVIVEFYDTLKSVTKGYASMSYKMDGLQKSNLVRVDILLNGNMIDPLSLICHKDKAEAVGRKLCERLKELIPRQQVDVAIQAAINGTRVIARETVKQYRKDVTAKLYGGDVSRRKKLLDKQKEGKKRMRSFANIDLPKEVFLNILKN
jgi:GTP-binding protein LepA